MVAKGWKQWRDGELLFKEFRVSVWKDEKVLETDRGDGCTTMCM